MQNSIEKKNEVIYVWQITNQFYLPFLAFYLSVLSNESIKPIIHYNACNNLDCSVCYFSSIVEREGSIRRELDSSIKWAKRRGGSAASHSRVIASLTFSRALFRWKKNGKVVNSLVTSSFWHTASKPRIRPTVLFCWYIYISSRRWTVIKSIFMTF